MSRQGHFLTSSQPLIFHQGLDASFFPFQTFSSLLSLYLESVTSVLYLPTSSVPLLLLPHILLTKSQLESIAKSKMLNDVEENNEKRQLTFETSFTSP